MSDRSEQSLSPSPGDDWSPDSGQRALCIAHGGDMGEPSGGTERVSALAQGLAERGHDVTLVVPEPSGALPERLAAVNVEPVAVRLSNPLIRAARVAAAARRVARDRDAILQIEHSTLAGVGTFRGCQDYVLDMHDLAYSRFDHVDTRLAPAFKRGVRRLERRAVERAAHVIVVSDVMRDAMRAWGVPDERLTVVPNGYFPTTIPEATESTVPGRVAFLGTLHPKVDIETLVAVARLPAVSELVVIGDGAQHRRLQRLGEGVDGLRLTGRLPDHEAFALLARSQVLINPQVVSAIQRSSSPVKLFYYAALGKPMVVTPGPSIVEHLVERRAAMTAYSKGSFAKRVRLALEDDELSARLAERARDAAMEFEWSRRADAVGTLYSRRSGGEPDR
ncbi:glycosyltransferase [Halococcus saccharolyticus]|uniref:Group 1 glycosyl transferase n=1 Tax=Halococcus saccharolyticus DSM 5350 TaxID=1227455 RepID=M0MJ99_9EURY|nr:glycosyltransferase [Halococcus saccharolyticus]EMA44809.1 group 1 glycosyl transferase [Halococcus saccharolyticus DSM 5350]